MTKWIEIKYGDIIKFKGKSGTGSVVFTENKGNYFMPAKLGMRIKGIKKPIKKYEEFVFNDSVVQSASGNHRVVKCFLTRISDNCEFAVSEQCLMRYFGKTNQSRLGGPLLD
tara:strand:- start:89 stop:424 length:336 start_codon:yes stop_codon:yes gene_type:complete